MGDLQKIEVEQRIRLALLRSRGNIRAAIEDYERVNGVLLSDDYVIRVYRKFRREVRRDNLRWVGYHFAQEFISQAATIQKQLDDQLREYNDRSVMHLSICCHSIVRPHPCGSGKWLCMKCNTQCLTYEEMNLPMERLKLKVIMTMQREQELTMKFLEGMGFLINPHAARQLEAPKDVTMLETSRAPSLPDIDPGLKQQLDSIDPRDAQVFLDGGELELEVEFEEDKNAGSGKSKSE